MTKVLFIAVYFESVNVIYSDEEGIKKMGAENSTPIPKN